MLRLERAGATEADRESSLPEPIDHLPAVAAKGDILGAEKLANEPWPEFGMVIKELHGRADLRARTRIEGDDLAFPLGLEQIVIRGELFGVDQRAVVIELPRAGVGEVSKNNLFSASR